MNKEAKIFIAGHIGIIGSNFIKYFSAKGYQNVITSEIDFTDQAKVRDFFKSVQPDYVILAAGKSGGILANQQQAGEFIYNNLQIQNNVIHAAYTSKVKKLLFIARSCCYPKECPQPIQEEMLLTGPLEATSEAFSVAKIAGIKLCQAYNSQYGCKFISVIPTNLYGPEDNFDPQSSHVLAALMRKIHEAKECDAKSITVWGTGFPEREFLYIEDFIEACVFLMKLHDTPEVINVGSGFEISIANLTLELKKLIGFKGDIVFDPSKPNGSMRKILDSRKILSLGWQAKIPFTQGLLKTYESYCKGRRNL